MPFPDKKYAKKYMKKYRKHKTQKLKAVEKAVSNGDLGRAKRILARPPKIHIRKRRKR